MGESPAKCHSCGADLKPEARFCGNCGASAVVGSRPTVQCPRCFRDQSAELEFCASCGAALKPKRAQGEETTAAPPQEKTPPPRNEPPPRETPAGGSPKKETPPGKEPPTRGTTRSTPPHSFGVPKKSSASKIVAVILAVVVVGALGWWYWQSAAPEGGLELTGENNQPARAMLSDCGATYFFEATGTVQSGSGPYGILFGEKEKLYHFTVDAGRWSLDREEGGRVTPVVNGSVPVGSSGMTKHRLAVHYLSGLTYVYVDDVGVLDRPRMLELGESNQVGVTAGAGMTVAYEYRVQQQ